MRNYFLETYPKKQKWSLSPFSKTPFFANAQGWSRDFQPASHADFTFLPTSEKASQRSLSGSIVFKASEDKTAEQLEREFLNFCSIAEFSYGESDVFSERNLNKPAADNPDDFASLFPATFSCLRIWSTQKGVEGRYAFCHLSSLNQIQRQGLNIIAQASFSLDSLWYKHHEIRVVGSSVGYGSTSQSDPSVSRRGDGTTSIRDAENINGKIVDAQLVNKGDAPAQIGIIASGYIAQISASFSGFDSTFKYRPKSLQLKFPENGYNSQYLALGRIGNKTIGYFQSDKAETATKYMTLSDGYGPSFTVRPGTAEGNITISTTARVPTNAAASPIATKLTIFWEDGYFNE